jgi:hypothetical protein
MKMKLPVLIFLLTLVIPAALTGCGPNLMGKEGSSDTTFNGDVYTGSTGTQSGDGFSCPANPNVIPYEDRVFDGTQHYTACPNASTPSQVEITGYSSTEDAICVFPVQYLDDYNFTYRVGPNGQPMYACYSTASSQTKTLDFQQTTFNGLVIVDQSEQVDMSRCLMTGQTCPTYSLGRIQQSP